MPRILVVEDDVRVGRGLAALLQRRGARAHVVTTVREALCDPNRFEAGIIVDYTLSDGTGIELLGRLRGEGVCGPAVLFTGRKCADLASEAAMYGAAYCEKASRGVGRMLSTLVEQTRRHALTVGGTERFPSRTTGPEHLTIEPHHEPCDGHAQRQARLVAHQPDPATRRRALRIGESATSNARNILTVGSPCPECRIAIAAASTYTGIVIEPHENAGSLSAALIHRPNTSAIVVFEHAGDTTALEELRRLRRLHRDRFHLGFVARGTDSEARREALRLGARYVDHTDEDSVAAVMHLLITLSTHPARIANLLAIAGKNPSIDQEALALLHLFILGTPDADLAHALHCSASTARRRKRALFQAFGIHDATALVRSLFALEESARNDQPLRSN